ncbi:MAG: 16S rRNA (guanine(527)-N(7))-methyltransferase RsmG [Deltaproteobacteria bacterium]|nr:16S rRNA (guanine(527)-N(7))-methyltransferase RsmG [Deltaproteobacteria bacterium]
MGREKSTQFSDELSLLAERASSFDIHLTTSEIELLTIHLRELLEWNQRFNLTGLKTAERIVIELFLDSLIPTPFLPKEGRILDVGSGAGFPGVPLKVLRPRADIRLLESNARKGNFLKHIIRLLYLNGVQVIRGRIERPGEWFDEELFKVITARALGDLRRVIPWCTPLLQDGGFLVTFLGAEGEKIIARNKAFIDSHGLRIYQHIPYSLTEKTLTRHTFILKKHEA